MSGGYFDYREGAISDIADSIEQIIRNNDDKTIGEYGETEGRGYKKDTIDLFMVVLGTLRLAAIFAHRIDYLQSGDDGEDSFDQRLTEDLMEYVKKAINEQIEPS